MFSVFPSFIYNMSWEDPRADEPILEIAQGDQVLTLTSGACNAFDLVAQGAIVHSVDMNPAQTHLLELKIAALKTLNYDEFWVLFGEGRDPNISLTFEKLRPHLSSAAIEFWQVRLYYFRDGLYLHGGMGKMIKAFQTIFWLLGLTKTIDALCNAPDIAAQTAIWDSMSSTKNRWFMWAMRLACSNPLVLWYGAGVPSSQAALIKADGLTVVDYTLKSLEGVIKNSSLKNENYFYLGVLKGRFTQECCPRYLKPLEFAKIKAMPAESRIYPHTATFLDELRARRYNKVILMDHVDWLDAQSTKELATALGNQVYPGGRIIWRSASQTPPYNKYFVEAGFKVRAVSQKASDGSGYIDLVNTYASFWVGERDES